MRGIPGGFYEAHGLTREVECKGEFYRTTLTVEFIDTQMRCLKGIDRTLREEGDPSNLGATVRRLITLWTVEMDNLSDVEECEFEGEVEGEQSGPDWGDWDWECPECGTHQ